MDSLNQACRFMDTYPDIPDARRHVIEELVSLRNKGFFSRLKYLTRIKVSRNDIIENLGLKIIILMGWH